MQKLDNVLIKQLEKNNIKYFWDVFNYLVLASFDEIDAILMANDYCNGDIWDGIIGAEIIVIELPKKQPVERNEYTIDNLTSNTMNISNTISIISHSNDYHIPITFGYINAYPKTFKYDKTNSRERIKIYLLNGNAKINDIELYKAYIKCNEYLDFFNDNIKNITFKLTSDLACTLFNNNCSNFMINAK